MRLRPGGTIASYSFPAIPCARSRPPRFSEVLRQLIAALGGTPESADFERLREAARILAGPHGGKIVQLGAGITLSTRAGWCDSSGAAPSGSRHT